MVAGVCLAGLVLWWAAGARAPDPGAAPAPLAALSTTRPATVPVAESGAGPGTGATPTTAAASGSVASGPPASTATPSATAAPGSTSWLGVLVQLDEQRSTAFATGSRDLLGDVYAAGSEPLARDTAVLDDLRGRGLRAVGLQLQIDEVSVVSAGHEAATLHVVDRLAPYELVDSAGTVVAAEPGRGPVTWTLTVTAGADGWRISEIEHATDR